MDSQMLQVEHGSERKPEKEATKNLADIRFLNCS